MDKHYGMFRKDRLKRNKKEKEFNIGLNISNILVTRYTIKEMSTKTSKQAESKKVAKTSTPQVESEKPVKKAVSKKTKATPQVESEKPVKKATSKKSKVVEPKEPTKEDENHSDENDEKKVRARRVVTKESVEADFGDLVKKVEEEIEKLRSSSDKLKGVKFLRSVNKALKCLRTDSARVLKLKPKNSHPRTTTSSGFMKPVRISDEMASFTGWEKDGLYSRVDVTKFICKYITDNNLQTPEDRRQIVCDEKLKALLKFDPSTAKDPLTYFRLQQYLQKHFVKVEEVKA